MNLSDNEIIKALECFALDKDFDDSQCIGCAFEHQFCTANMSVDIAKPALDLITRQKTEIGDLRHEIRNLECEKGQLEGTLEYLVEQAKAEAIKEFADKLETELIYFEEHFIEVQDWSARNTISLVLNTLRKTAGDME